MSKKVNGVVCCLLFLISSLCFGAEPRQLATDQEKARTLYIFHQPIVMLQAKFGFTTPEERVLRIRNTLRSLTEEDIRQPVQVHVIKRYNQQGRLFTINGKPFMLLTQGDLDEGDDLTLDQASQRVLARFNAQRTALLEQYSSTYLAIAVAKSAAGSLALALVFYAAFKSWQRVKKFYATQIALKRGWIPQSWRVLLGAFESRLYALLMILLSIGALYIWLSWLFRLFPWTRIWGESLGDWSISVIQKITLSIVSAFPGLVIVAIIFLLTGFILKLLKALLKRVESGRLVVPGLHPETVGATRKLISVMVWLFALSAAYPFLPGADSLAFKGVSVFFGLMLTLGSAGLMNHAMSGLVLTYSRALRKGDFIKIGDNEGLVSEVGMLATKILTRESYIVTVPNAVVVSGKITNLSALNPGDGINLTTSVTIGYDTPWRQVHAMLELAANRTKGIDNRVRPLVRQLNLMDWYIAYELQVRLGAGESVPSVKSELHSHIQDVFNEFNVQIMSPNFVLQPENAVMVARENWYAAPAAQPDKQP
ncbi:mechanosensitive ion channel [Serratia proteamaculans]|uniref:mechanosensitive ion channel family protein n=1 Tax=Serratia proteamaculans TaxID=28151 RepID=UPI0015755BB1|nr:mechanosensitive ion channel domain-containing protein [Serratia proteamaculans]NTX78889.1 mechanosensitive ion channel [Serratia proteamaculans]NTZ26870.1 mechanosensitive ion channel [Serratia proteamaculans]